jgi:molybdopterin-guanine dinucleotide biosynthesis protein A
VEASAAELIACVLAGGRARRLGGAKATALLAGRPLISYPLDSLRWAGLEAVVVAKHDSPLPEVDVPVWHEPEGPAHPAAGIAEALRRAAGRPVLAIACDMPLLPPGLALHLAQRGGRLVVPSTPEGMHPLCARYEADVLAPLEQAVPAGTPLHEVIEALGPELIEGEALAAFGDPETTLFNVNTRADLARAEELLRG